jgi:photosystem II stability/assembly factor-like uncharacterized protein
MKRKKFLKIFLVITLVCCLTRVSGQNDVSGLYLQAQTDDFAAIQHRMKEYFANRDQGQGSGYKQWKRWEYLMERRLTPDGKVANWALLNWEAYNSYLEQHPDADGSGTDATNGQWIGLGPWGYVRGSGWNGGVGRTNCIAFHPTLANTYWVGTPSGGLWKTTDDGATWAPLTDGMPLIGISGIAVDYTNTNVIYILTGDGDAGVTFSIGVLKSTDGGLTWMKTGYSRTVQNFVRGYKLVMHPTNHDILYVVSSDGILRTTDGGATWTQAQYGGFQDIEFRPGDPAVMYASDGTKFYRSTNTGETWTRIYSGVPTNALRMAIGVSPNNPDFVYLFAGPTYSIGTFVGVYCSFNSGLDFRTQSTTPNLLGYDMRGMDQDDQTKYDLAMTVSRINVNQIIVGGINTWVSNNTGNTGYWSLSSMWNYTAGPTKYTHADIHGLEINPLNNNLYCMSDGGIFRSTDFGQNWTDLTAGIANTQFYRIAGYQANSNFIVGGTQDNGSDKWTGGPTMEHMRGGDGMDCMIDFTDSDIIYTTTQNGKLAKTTDGGLNFFEKKPAGSLGAWVTPFVMNPVYPQVIYGGYINGVYKSYDGGNIWFNMGAAGCNALAIGTDNMNRLYAAMDSGSTAQVHYCWRSNDAGSNWTSIRPGLPAIFVSFIAVDPHNSLSVFVTFSGYTAGQKVYHSTDGGATWTNISGTLPNVPANCIAFADNNGSPGNALYVGTDIGVFYRDDNHADWIPFRNGLPTVPVFDLEINYGSGVITAGTYGRGLWRSTLYNACPSYYTLMPENDPSNPGYTGFQFYEASNGIESSRVITGGIGTDVTYKAAHYVKLTTGFNAKENNLFKASLGNCINNKSTVPQFRKVTGKYIGKANDW